MCPVGYGQQPASPCDPPVLTASARGANIFSEQQENDLGDAVAEHLQRTFRVIEDERLTAYLAAIGARITAQLPPTAIRFQFAIVDIPEANAFTLPGGRIYVARKLIAITESEDELAGVIAHETGHVMARHAAIEMTRIFRDVLGVTSVTDRKDIFEKYNRMVENAARKPKAFEGTERESDDQVGADQIGLYALAKAGYKPAAFATFFDRLAETKGQTGNFFSDLFGTTNPEARRLRVMLKTAAALPASCITSTVDRKAEDFLAWRASVVGFTGTGSREALHAVRTRVALEPPLRSEITSLKFSPDGRYILAQDDSGIAVLTREPLAPLFRIDAPEANPAHFTPNSQLVVFCTPTGRVEEWDVATGKLSSAHEIYVRAGGLQMLLSPDARTLACLDGELSLLLFDVATGASVFQKQHFYIPNPVEILLVQLRNSGEEDEDVDFNWINMDFSPDGKYFAAGARSATTNFGGGIVSEVKALAVDLGTRQTVGLKGPVKKMLSGGFAFVSPARIVGVNIDDTSKSGIVGFPQGDNPEPFVLNPGTIAAASAGNYILKRPAADYPVGVMSLDTKEIILANKQSALDVYNDTFVSERQNGEIGVYALKTKSLITSVKLPPSPLVKLKAVAVSPDLSTIAVSQRLRGAVWNAETGERLFHVRGFRSGFFADDGVLYAEFPKHDAAERTVMKMHIASRSSSNGPALAPEHESVSGPFIITRKALAGDLSELTDNVEITISDVRTKAKLWSRTFPREAPEVYVETGAETLVLLWQMSDEAATAEIKADPRLSQRLGLKKKEKEADYFLQVVDARTGKLMGQLIVETGLGSFDVADLFAVGGWVVVADTANRILIYSVASGEQKGKVFGTNAAINPAGTAMVVENAPGKLAFYTLPAMEKRDELAFGNPVVLAQYSRDGHRLFVLDSRQTVYVVDVDALGEDR